MKLRLLSIEGALASATLPLFRRRFAGGQAIGASFRSGDRLSSPVVDMDGR